MGDIYKSDRSGGSFFGGVAVELAVEMMPCLVKSEAFPEDSRATASHERVIWDPPKSHDHVRAFIDQVLQDGSP